MNIFKIENLIVRFNIQQPPILRVVDMLIEQGKFISVLGNSGSGKTTFIESLGLMSKYYDNDSSINYYPNGIVEPVNYNKLWEDDDEVTRIRREYFSFLFQEAYLLKHLNLIDNVIFSSVGFSQDIEKLKNMARIELDKLGINSNRNLSKVNALSGGERQRVAFARIALEAKKVLFADEPTGNLGEEESILIMERIRKYVDDGNMLNTAIVVTHNRELAWKYSDKIMYMSKINGSNIIDGSCVINPKNISLNEFKHKFVINKI